MKLIVILPRFPFPTEKGDKLRAFHQLKILSCHHEIFLFALSHQPVSQAQREKVAPHCSEMFVFRLNWFTTFLNLIRAIFKRWPLQVGYYFSGSVYRKIRNEINRIQPDHIYCQLLRTAPYAINLHINKTLDYQDVFSKGVERRIPQSGFFMKPLLRIEMKRLRAFEAYVFDHFNHKTIISVPDRDFIPHAGKDQIVVVPNGVDHTFFRPMKQPITHDLVFTGNMGYPPNVNCAEYLVKQVLPLLRKSYPELTLMLAGATPHARVKALAGEKVIVTGWVDDIRECYAGARIFLAPMQIGTGLQNKLLEAMSMQLPCITSSLCNAALKAIPGKDILIGDTPEEVAAQVIRLLGDEMLQQSIAKSGLNFVHRNYSWQGATNQLLKLID
ncbi:MAG: glycosyltransferase [Lentimicrobium sp.]|jgi:glycosyltransferase involved in cell wall biosynthesis|nr:glycosyltransferase [Lentimicrobium sp.]